MRKPTTEILIGDAADRLASLPAGHFHTCITSPPYWGLRDYGMAEQIGLEETPREFTDRLVAVFESVRRVLRDDGTLWINIGDSYSQPGQQMRNRNGVNPEFNRPCRDGVADSGRKIDSGLKPKDLCGIPWRLAFALQDAGWYLRQEIIWHKPNPMPESVRDRCTKAHESIFLLTKRPAYYYDADAIRSAPSGKSGGASFGKVDLDGPGSRHMDGGRRDREDLDAKGANARSVWTINTQACKEAHFATFPQELPTRCIKAGTSEAGCCPTCGAPRRRVTEKQPTNQTQKMPSGFDTGPGRHGAYHRDGREKGKAGNPVTTTTTIGWEATCECEQRDAAQPCRVLDPFSGAATTGMAAALLGRDYTGIELNPDYAEIGRRRIAKATRPSTARTDAEDPAPLFGR